jgi:hypothetical protein
MNHSLYNFLHSLGISSLLDPTIHRFSLFSDYHSVCSSCNMDETKFRILFPAEVPNTNCSHYSVSLIPGRNVPGVEAAGK